MDIFACLKNNSLKVNLNRDNGRFKLELLDLSVKGYKCVLFLSVFQELISMQIPDINRKKVQTNLATL